MKPTCFSIALAAAALLAAVPCSRAAITVEKTASGGAIVKADGEFFAEYVIDQANKPYLWPVVGVEGRTMTRAYPMQTIEGEQHDHPHHRGICFGHEGINGVETWAEEATYASSANDPKRGERARQSLARMGREKHREFKEMKVEGDTAVLVSVIDYLDPNGKKFLEEERRMTFHAGKDSRSIDMDQTFTAVGGTANFEDKKDAGLSIRVPTEMAVEMDKGKAGSGHIINSEGVKDLDAWGKRAKWCDYHGTVKGARVGVAILNHPSSFRFPTPWHVRTYGLFTANPFGTNSLDKNAESGAFDLKEGEKFQLHHRFFFHKGDEQEGKVAEAWEAYSKEQK